MEFKTSKVHSNTAMKSEDSKYAMLEEHLDIFKQYCLKSFKEGKFDFKYYEPSEQEYISEINMNFEFKQA